MTDKTTSLHQDSTNSPINGYPFLAGGGEMGELTRNYDWSKTSLGMPEQWPKSLRTTLGIVLHSAFPMFLFWGDALTCFYNDAYRPSLGNNGKHPGILGQSGKEAWPEIWAFIGPLIDQVLTTGSPVWFEDQLLPIFRNGQLEDVYWTFSYSPAYGDEGQINGVFVTCTETTRKVQNLVQIAESKAQLEFAIDATELGTWDLNPATGKFIGNDRLKDWFGLPPGAEVPLSWAIDVMAEQDRDRVAAAIQRALTYSSGGHYDIDYTIIHPTTQQLRIVRAKGKAWFNDDQTPYRFNGTLQDITQQAIAHHQVAESELQSRSLVEQSPVRTVLLTGQDMIITRANEPVLKSWGKDASVIGKPLLEILPEMKGQSFPQLLADVYATGTPYTAYEAPVTLTREGMEDTQYYDFTYQPMHTTSGEIYGVLSTSVDVTEKVKARQLLENSERNLRSLILQAPVAMSISKGPTYSIEIANDRMFEIWGRNAEAVLNKPVFEVFPEAKGQGFEEILNHTYTTGETYRANELPVKLLRNGTLETVYVNVTYQPIREGSGTIGGIMQVAIEVTDQVLARKKIEESEAKLRSVIAAAPAAIGLLIGPEHVVESPNQTFIDILGKGPGIIGKPLAEAMPELITENQPFLRILDEVYATGQPFHTFDSPIDIVQHGVLNRGYYNFSYTPLFDQQGKVYAILDIAIDVTDVVKARQQLEASEGRYRMLSEELEQQVQERTEELAAINEELATTNEELAAANEEMAATNEKLIETSKEIAQANKNLEDANLHLTRSNQNLEQFAYIASHDLQEPLRKIQQFGDLLKTRYATSSGDDLVYLERMQSAASRMSLLIKDLLAFSRISTRQAATDSVSLSQIVEQALDNLSVAISETKAHIQVDTLPIIQGDASQLGQLFQNLLSNAIKFSCKDYSGNPVPPQITIRVRSLLADELPVSVKPARQAAAYYAIEVADNGIGFEEKYTDRIFQVFQRLHGKNEFAGTGVGLAIVQKVVINHGGAISATSQPGQGATFSVYLPI